LNKYCGAVRKLWPKWFGLKRGLTKHLP